MGLESATYIASLVATNPVGSTDAKSQGDDHLRLIKSTVLNSFPGVDKATFLHQARADVASASVSTNLPLATTDFIRITGTTTITALGTMGAGTRKYIVFGGALTLTYNVTSLILPSAANILTVAGDTMVAISLGSGNWTVIDYTRATGKAVVPPAMSEVSSIFNTLLSGFVGVIFEWPGTLATVPTGFLPCDGRAVSRTTYSALFALFSTAFGVGDGVNTFNLPDDRGRVTAGMDNMGTAQAAANRITDTAADSLGGTYGEETHVLTVAELAAHTHTLAMTNVPFGNAGTLLTGKLVSTGDTTGSTGSDTAHNNVQPTTFRHKIIWTGVV